jgi:hypothetical protein
LTRSLTVSAVLVIAFACSIFGIQHASPGVTSASASSGHNRRASPIAPAVVADSTTPGPTVGPNTSLTPTDVSPSDDGGANVAKNIVTAIVLGTLGVIVLGLLVGGWFLVRAERSKRG